MSGNVESMMKEADAYIVDLHSAPVRLSLESNCVLSFYRLHYFFTVNIHGILQAGMIR